MTVRNLLNKIRKCRYMVDALTADLKHVRCDAYSLHAVKIGDKVQSSHTPDLSRTIERIESYEIRLQAAIDELMTLKAKAGEIIKAEPDLCARAILYRRFILAESWDEIVYEVGYSRSWVSKVLEESIERLEHDKQVDKAIQI